MPARLIAALLLLAACASDSPFDDIAGLQQRLDERGIGFGLTRVPGHDAMVFQLRLRTSEAGAEEAPDDPMTAAIAAAPPGCSVKSITEAADKLSFTAAYAC
jgi:hypothetical protein